MKNIVLFFESIPTEIAVALISSLGAIYISPQFTLSKRRKLLEHKLLNVYAPMALTITEGIKFSTNKNSYINLCNSLLKIIEANYPYVPKDIFDLTVTYKLLIEENKIKEAFDVLQKLDHVVLIEEWYCQRKLRFDEQYVSSGSYNNFSLVFYLVYRAIFPILTFLNIFALIIILLSLVTNLEYPKWSACFSFLLIIFEVIDFSLSKKAKSKKLLEK